MYRVAVLMSTFNGEKYLREQIDSILAQEGVDVTLYIRDDGSSDSTVEIIKGYQKNNSNIRLDIGKNMGVGNSFMQLVYDVGDDFDYYAFSDQDDVWHPEKIYRAVEMIKTEVAPCLYCSNQILVEKDGTIIAERHEHQIHKDYLGILCNNEVTGCTMLWNKGLHDLLSDAKRRPSQKLLRIRIHDVWVAMVASTVGIICYDTGSYIDYRQHDNNVVGVKKRSLINEWSIKIMNPELRNGRSILAEEIYDKFRDLIKMQSISNSLKICKDYRTSMKSKIHLLKDADIQRCSKESKTLYIMKILLNLF